MTAAVDTATLAPDFHGYLTVDEVISYGLEYVKEPRAEPCEHCGNLLIPKAYIGFGRVLNWIAAECNCDKTIAEIKDRRRKALSGMQRRWSEEQDKINAERDEAKRTQFTLSELQAKNFPLDPETTPKPFVCEFCGETTDPQALVFWGVVMWRQPFCECEQGKAKHEAEVAAENARIAAEEEQKKAREHQERVRRILGDSGINNRFMSRTFENFKQDTPQREQAYANAKRYADEYAERFAKDGTGLYIEGTFGTGKTHLAVAIALHLINQGVKVICKTSIDLLMDIKAAFRYENGEEEKTSELKRCPLLVIDDLGKEQCTEWSLPKLYEIVNDRYEKCKPTIVTTNYSHDELVKRLVPKGGDNVTAGALVSRLKESSIILPMVWHDFRVNGR